MHLELPSFSIRPFAPDDVPSLARSANDERIARWTSDRFPHPYTVEHARAFIAAAKLQWALVVEGDVAGGIGLYAKDDIHRRGADIGYWLAPVYWGRGIATRAVAVVCEHAFEALDLIRVQALVFEGNAASVRVFEKCSFALEGILRRASVKRGRVLDELVYARLRDDT